MVLGIQLVGVLFVLVMLYLTYLYYKKGQYSKTSAIFWVIIWGAAMILLTFQQSVERVIEQLQFARVFDLYMTIGLLFVLALMFYDYVRVERLERKVEELVRKIATERAKK